VLDSHVHERVCERVKYVAQATWLRMLVSTFDRQSGHKRVQAGKTGYSDVRVNVARWTTCRY